MMTIMVEIPNLSMGIYYPEAKILHEVEAKTTNTTRALDSRLV